VLTGIASAQTSRIEGTAGNTYRGQEITVSVVPDYITGISVIEDRDTIGSDGGFSLSVVTGHTRPVTLHIGRAAATLYVRPGAESIVHFPDAIVSPQEKEISVDLVVMGRDSTELNARIFDFQEVYNRILARQSDRYLSRQLLFKRADSLQKFCESRYRDVKDQYFTSYVKFSIASLNAAISRGETFLVRNYIIEEPIDYEHNEYMQFFATCFRGYFNSVASRYKGKSIYHIINKEQSLDNLDIFLRQDPYLKRDSLRELVLIANLWEAAHTPEFNRDAVEKLVTLVNHKTPVEAHRKITSHMISYFSHLSPGSQAPDFRVMKPDGSVGKLSDLKGRWVYLNFFSTRNLEALREMPKIASLQKQFGDKVTFLSICVDDSASTYSSYLRSNPKIQWPVWHDDVRSAQSARKAFGVAGSEAYFLVSNTGVLSQAPALAPSKGIENRFTQLFRVRKRTTKTGIR
jgi:peroxiredoxin